MYSIMRSRRLSKLIFAEGWLTEPHQILSLLDGSSTTNLSLGERPVYWPVLTTRGPSAPSIPSPLRIACSTRRACGEVVPRFVYFDVKVGIGSRRDILHL